MTTKNQFVEIFDLLCIAYTDRIVRMSASAEERANVMRVWYLILKDLDTDLLRAAALEFMSSPSAFPPTPGQVRDRAIRLTKRTNNVPSAAEAWQEVLGSPVDGVTRRSEETPDGWVIYNQPYQWSNPLTEKVARNLGWPKNFWTDNMASDRARFLQAYDRQIEYTTEEVTSLPEVRDYIERGRSDIKTITDGFKRAALDRGE